MLLFAIIPMLLWDQGPQSAPVLEKAGIREIATPNRGEDWAGKRVRANLVDASRLVRLDAPGVDYAIGRAGATAVPWINSNLWRELRDTEVPFVYDVAGAGVLLAAAEAYSSGAEAYLRIKPEDLATFASAMTFLRQMDGPRLQPRVNFALVTNATPEMEEVMNLLVRRNLLFQPVAEPVRWKGMLVRPGTGEFDKEATADPYRFAAMVRSRIGDDRRLVRIYGSDTVLARLYGDERHSRVHLLQYGRNTVAGLRVRVAGRYPRVLVASPGERVLAAEDVVVDGSRTEFTIPEFQTYAIADLDAAEPGVLASTWSESEFELTADPATPHWRTAKPSVLDRSAFGGPLPFGRTEVRSRWTRDSLYLLYSCPFDSLNLKSDPVTDRDTPQLWNWDVAEAFIGAPTGDIGQYREYQISPQGEWVDLDIDVVHPKPDGGIGWNSGYQVKARIDRAAKVWYGEMRIPLRSIAPAQWKAGDRMRLGLFRIAGAPPDRTLVAWQPSFRRNFHVPEAFGTLLLEGRN